VHGIVSIMKNYALRSSGRKFGTPVKIPSDRFRDYARRKRRKKAGGSPPPPIPIPPTTKLEKTKRRAMRKKAADELPEGQFPDKKIYKDIMNKVRFDNMNMYHLIELARSEAAKDMEKKVNKVGTIGAGLAAAGTLGAGLYKMRKGKMHGAFKPKIDKKMSESLAEAEKTRKAMQARNLNFKNKNHLIELARKRMSEHEFGMKTPRDFKENYNKGEDFDPNNKKHVAALMRYTKPGAEGDLLKPDAQTKRNLKKLKKRYEERKNSKRLRDRLLPM
jgi:hypothetical protein